MKYRIKDPNLRQALESLFGEDLVFNFNMKLSQATAKLSLRTSYELPYTEEIKLEPVPETVDGWHSYPADKPDKVDNYIVAYDCDGEERGVDVMVWNGESFFPCDSDAVAWQEFPKYW